MNSVDTNVVVRFLVRDDERQARRARALFAEGDAFVPKTVLLEAEWVLRYSYELERQTIADGLDKLLRMEGVTVEDVASVQQAIGWHRQGLDFADALHLAASPAGATFRSFDRDLKRKAARAGGPAVESP